MGVRIEAETGNRLRLTGDIETVLDVPSRGVAEGFSLAFSDGTLVRGSFANGAHACRFTLTMEGAALVKIVRHRGGDVLDLDWNFDWIALASGDQTLQSQASLGEDAGRQLALDIELNQVA